MGPVEGDKSNFIPAIKIDNNNNNIAITPANSPQLPSVNNLHSKKIKKEENPLKKEINPFPVLQEKEEDNTLIALFEDLQQLSEKELKEKLPNCNSKNKLLLTQASLLLKERYEFFSTLNACKMLIEVGLINESLVIAKDNLDTGSQIELIKEGIDHYLIEVNIKEALTLIDRHVEDSSSIVQILYGYRNVFSIEVHPELIKSIITKVDPKENQCKLESIFYSFISSWVKQGKIEQTLEIFYDKSSYHFIEQTFYSSLVWKEIAKKGDTATLEQLKKELPHKNAIHYFIEAHVRKKEYQKAEELYLLQPKNQKLLIHYTLALTKMDQFEKVHSLFEEIETINFRSSPIYIYLSKTLLKKGREEEALSIIEHLEDEELSIIAQFAAAHASEETVKVLLNKIKINGINFLLDDIVKEIILNKKESCLEEIIANCNINFKTIGIKLAEEGHYDCLSYPLERVSEADKRKILMIEPINIALNKGSLKEILQSIENNFPNYSTDYPLSEIAQKLIIKGKLDEANTIIQNIVDSKIAKSLIFELRKKVIKRLIELYQINEALDYLEKLPYMKLKKDILYATLAASLHPEQYAQYMENIMENIYYEEIRNEVYMLPFNSISVEQMNIASLLADIKRLPNQELKNKAISITLDTISYQNPPCIQETKQLFSNLKEELPSAGLWNFFSFAKKSISTGAFYALCLTYQDEIQLITIDKWQER